MAREKLKETLLKHYAVKGLPTPSDTALEESMDNLVAFFELLIQEDRKNGGVDERRDQRDPVHPDPA
ncbi:MAG: hypothetical protein HY211_01575 [Candidatus Omnitrophica bacterium]|nr:hypothetical protein [Candidatus Omnitrophota bacterium]